MLKFESVEWSERQDCFDRVYRDELTGFVLRNALDANIIDQFKAAINENKEKFYTDLNSGNGFSLPVMFGQVHKSQPQEKVDTYFNSIAPFCAAIDRSCAFDVRARIEALLNDIVEPKHVAVLPGFLPYSFRVVNPGMGGLYIHKDGDLLPEVNPTVSQQIQQYIIPTTMMSWFFSLQSPVSGGELWVADSDYSKYEKRGQFDLIDSNGEPIRASDMTHVKVSTPTGSLLVFKGGSYWHKVLPPYQDDTVRITLGGFFAQGKDGNTIYYWS